MILRFVARAVIAVAVLGGVLTFSSAASAYQFGTDEAVTKLIDVDIVSQDNKKLYLGHKTSTLFVLLGVYVTDDGYVFGAQDEADTYYETSAEELKSFQAKGLLPTPLPAYSLSIFDYMIGYSLWIALAVIALVYLIGWLRKRDVPDAEPTAPSA